MVCGMTSPRNTEAAHELASRLSTFRAEAGQPAYDKIFAELANRMGYDDAPKEIQIRRAHQGHIDPSKCDYQLLAGLAAFYRRTVRDLGPTAARRNEVIDGLGSGSSQEAVAA